jgi:hypothetical protein
MLRSIDKSMFIVADIKHPETQSRSGNLHVGSGTEI